MIAALRLLACAGSLALAGSFLELASPGSLAQASIDLIRLPMLRVHLREQLELGHRLTEQSAALMARARAKHQILKDLIDERLTLIESAKRFRDLDRELLNGLSAHPPQPPLPKGGQRGVNGLGFAWPGRTELERYCHQIIQAAKWELCERPCMARAVVTRLEAEFQAAMESGVFCLLG
jgi:hypothetical protein